jgi:hypothetical protein
VLYTGFSWSAIWFCTASDSIFPCPRIYVNAFLFKKKSDNVVKITLRKVFTAYFRIILPLFSAGNYKNIIEKYEVSIIT